jgi:hypothetical protein
MKGVTVNVEGTKGVALNLRGGWRGLIYQKQELETKFFLHYYSILKKMTVRQMKRMASFFAGANEFAVSR